MLSGYADRDRVSLIAAILRWLAYRDGEAVARCAIRLGDGMGSRGITYSHIPLCAWT